MSRHNFLFMLPNIVLIMSFGIMILLYAWILLSIFMLILFLVKMSLVIWMIIKHSCISNLVLGTFVFWNFMWFIGWDYFNTSIFWFGMSMGFVLVHFYDIWTLMFDDSFITFGSIIVSLSTLDSLLVDCSNLFYSDFLSLFSLLLSTIKLRLWTFKHESSSKFSRFSTLFLRSWFSDYSYNLLICSSNLWLRFLRIEASSFFSTNFLLNSFSRSWFSCSSEWVAS